MSEILKTSHEQHHEPNHELKKHKESLQAAAEKKAETSKNEYSENIGEIRSRIEAASKSKQEQHPSRQHEHEPERQVLVNKELKDMSYRRTLKRAQSHLPAPARAFSKVIHNPAVDAVSEAAGKTIARPSGVLLGGIFAFLGSAIFLWITRHYGYEYNYLLFAVCFAGGFFVGLSVELGLKLATRKSR